MYEEDKFTYNPCPYGSVP